MSSGLAPRAGAELSTGPRRDPTADWPEEARAFAEEFEQHYPTGDPFPKYARQSGAHLLAARFGLAETFARYLETAPTLRPVKGGTRGEKAPVGPPRSDTARANVLRLFLLPHVRGAPGEGDAAERAGARRRPVRARAPP